MGENPQRDADFYQNALPTEYSIAMTKRLNGRSCPSIISVMPITLFALSVTFKDRPTVVALKHMNPAASVRQMTSRQPGTMPMNPVSIFGGIVVPSTEVDLATAEKNAPDFPEIIAPSYSERGTGENLRILNCHLTPRMPAKRKQSTHWRRWSLGSKQDVMSIDDWQVVTERYRPQVPGKPSSMSKSNGIIITNDKMTLGVRTRTDQPWPLSALPSTGQGSPGWCRSCLGMPSSHLPTISGIAPNRHQGHHPTRWLCRDKILSMQTQQARHRHGLYRCQTF